MKNVLITGGARGIGAATVRAFAREHWRVAFCYRAAADEAARLSAETGAAGYVCDVRDSAAVAAMVDSVSRLFGHIDALVNNAGVCGSGLITDFSDERWRDMMAVDLDGVFYATRAVVPGMVSRKRGAIVNVSSIWGVTGASCEAPYSAAKAGVIGLTKALAKELGPSGVRVNCVCPGVIDTAMNARLTESEMAALIEATPLGRIGTPEDVAAAIAFLCGDGAGFITGQVLGVDGGFIG